jgi:Mce-associated membrane protein
LTGEVPFPRDTTAARMFAHLSAPAPALGEINPALRGPLEPVLAKALAKRPADRYPTAGEFGRAALAAVSQMGGPHVAQLPFPAPGHQQPSPYPPFHPGPARRGGLLAAPITPWALALWGAAGLVLAVFAATFGVLWSRGELRDPTENRAVVDAVASAQVAQQVGKAIETIYSYDFAHLDEAEKSGRAVITPEFEQTFTQLFSDVRAKASQQQAVVTAKVLQAGVRELTDDTAVLLVFVDQTAGRTVGDAAPEPLASAGTLTVTAKDVGGVWKIAAVSTE